MKLSFNKVILSCLVSLLPLLSLLDSLVIEYDKIEIVIAILVIVTMLSLFYIPNNMIKIGLGAITIVLLLITVNIPDVIDGTRGLGERYGETVNLYNNGMINELDSIKLQNISSVIRIYAIIMIPCLFVVYKNKFWKVVYIVVSIPYFILSLSVGKVPNMMVVYAMAFLYADIVIIDNSNIKHIDMTSLKVKNIRMIIVSAIVIITLVGVSIYNSVNPHKRTRKTEQLKAEINAILSGDKSFSLGELLDWVSGGTGHGGMNNGRLGQLDAIEFSGMDILNVNINATLEPKMFPMYIKSFVGAIYKGDRWESGNADTDDALEEIADKYDMSLTEIDEISYNLLNYMNEDMYILYDSNTVNINTVTIENIAKDGNAYWPYFAATKLDSEHDGQRVPKGNDMFYQRVYFNVKLPNYTDVSNINANFGTYPYFDLSNDYTVGAQTLATYKNVIQEYEKFVYDNYLSTPDSFDAISEEIKDTVMEYRGDTITLINEESKEKYGLIPYINYVKEYLNNRCVYSLSPGKLNSGEDFVDKFLNVTHEGYCSHFASAATLMFRALGIPARYVEGYSVSRDLLDKAVNGNIVVKDDSAHAWVELFVDGFGWVPVDVTPSDYRDTVIEYINNGQEPTTPETTDNQNITTPEPTTQEPTTQEPTTSQSTTQNTSDGSNETTTLSGAGTSDGNNSNRFDPMIVILPMLYVAAAIMAVGVVILGFKYRYSRNQKKYELLIAKQNYRKICKKFCQQIEQVLALNKKSVDYFEKSSDLIDVFMSIDENLNEAVIKVGAITLYKLKYSNETIDEMDACSITNLAKELTMHTYNNGSSVRKFYMAYLKCLYLFGK